MEAEDNKFMESIISMSSIGFKENNSFSHNIPATNSNQLLQENSSNGNFALNLLPIRTGTDRLNSDDKIKIH